jgi:hypothetical protein
MDTGRALRQSRGMRFKKRALTLTASPAGCAEQLAWLPLWIEQMLHGEYLAWRRECLAVQEAYECWLAASPGSSAFAYASYLTALDREQDAAEQYARGIKRS